MREIKFRGKRLDNVEWITGDLIRMSGYTFIFPDPAPNGFDRYMVDPATVGQYTGLKDKNGKDIWEGDIVEWENLIKTNMRSVIAYRDRMFCFVDANNEPEEIWCCSFTKIGNIHDNPELLKTE
jgi:uncharacterized phage protein (TIGR01671 family)